MQAKLLQPAFLPFLYPPLCRLSVLLGRASSIRHASSGIKIRTRGQPEKKKEIDYNKVAERDFPHDLGLIQSRSPIHYFLAIEAFVANAIGD